MACFAGKNGIVSIAAGAVGEMTNYSIEETADTLECTAMGNDFKEFISSFIGWTASIDYNWDPADAGQILAVAGDSVALLFYPENDEVGMTEFSGTGIIQTLTTSAAFDGLVQASVTIQGTGELVLGTKS